VKIYKSIVLFIVFFLLLESLLRIFSYPSTYTSIYKIDDDLGYSLRNGKHKINANGEVHHINIIENNNADVIILGDGLISGFDLKNNNYLSDRVSDELQLNAVNLSVPGYGTVQQLIILDRYLSKADTVPKYVFIVYNFSNDYFDNVQKWEGLRVPTIRFENNKIDIINPVLPSKSMIFIRHLAWNSRVFSLYKEMVRSNLRKADTINERQEVLFSEFDGIGDIKTKLAIQGIEGIRKKYGFNIVWLGWHDTPLEEKQKLNSNVADVKLRSFLPMEHKMINIETNGGYWKERYLHPKTRHLNKNSIDLIVDLIVNNKNDY
jgi:hypothetical protein